MNKLTIVLTGLISILFTTSAIAQVPTDQARNFQIDATHTGSVTAPGLTPPLKEKWVVNFGQPISYPVIADGQVLITVKDPTPVIWRASENRKRIQSRSISAAWSLGH